MPSSVIIVLYLVLAQDRVKSNHRVINNKKG